MPMGAAQTDDAPSNTQVLIIGAGPAGLFAACELLRHGVKPRIVEQRSAPHHETRGTGLQPAILEVLHKGGVVAPFLASSARIREVELWVQSSGAIGLAEFAGLGCKYEFQCSQPQWRTETVLRDHLAGQGLKIEFGVEAKSDRGRWRWRHGDPRQGRAQEVVRADYLIGADSGHSVTRHSMQEHLDGETYGGRFIVADVRLTLPAPPGRARIVVGPSGFVLLAPLPEGRWLIFVNREGGRPGRETAVRGRSRGAAQHPDWSRRRTLRLALDFILPDAQARCPGPQRRQALPVGRRGASFKPDGRGRDQFGAHGRREYRVETGARPSRGRQALAASTLPIERGLADRHVLEVSNEIHGLVMQLVEKCRAGEALSLPAEDPAEALAGLRKRSMLDVSYKGSLLIERALPTPSQRPERAFPAGAISRARPTTSSFPAARRSSTISGRDGTASSPSSNGQAQDVLAKQAGLGGGRHCSGPPGWLHRLPARRGG